MLGGAKGRVFWESAIDCSGVTRYDVLASQSLMTIPLSSETLGATTSMLTTALWRCPSPPPHRAATQSARLCGSCRAMSQAAASGGKRRRLFRSSFVGLRSSNRCVRSLRMGCACCLVFVVSRCMFTLKAYFWLNLGRQANANMSRVATDHGVAKPAGAVMV